MSGELGNSIDHDLQVGEITGWRGWHLVYSYEKPRLISPDMRTVWMPGREMEAFCEHDYEARLMCMCGINAYRSRNLLETSSRIHHTLVGEIAMWGDVQAYEKGYRSQYARLSSLYIRKDSLTARDVSELTKEYQIPVYVYEYLDGKIVYYDQTWSNQFSSFAHALKQSLELCQQMDYLTQFDPFTSQMMAVYLWSACTIQENHELVNIWLDRYDAPTTYEAISSVLDYAQIDEATQIWNTYSSLGSEKQHEICTKIRQIIDAKTLLSQIPA